MKRTGKIGRTFSVTRRVAPSWALSASTLSLCAATSANYSIVPDTLDGGGGLSSSANYSQVASLESSATGSSSSANYGIRHGYIGELSGVISDLVGAFTFYNGSVWDGSSVAANVNDDLAIATDKTALLPGGTATFANYTSYSRGLNGVMVDILNLPSGSVTVSDFAFRVGNDSTPNTWSPAPTPVIDPLSFRPSPINPDATRVTIIWANNAIQKQWLEVKVLPTAATGFSTVKSFFFGNAIGESGNSSLNAAVTSADASGALNNLHPVADLPISSRFDYNRDRKIISSDASIALNNLAVGPSALQLINLGLYTPTSPQRSAILLGAGVDPGTEGVLDALSSSGRDRTGALELIGFGDTLANTAGPRGGADVRIWFHTATDDPGQVFHLAGLEDGEWTLVPAENVHSVGDGFHEIRIPAATAGEQSFFKFAPSCGQGQ